MTVFDWSENIFITLFFFFFFLMFMCVEQVEISVCLYHMSSGCQGEHFWFGLFSNCKDSCKNAFLFFLFVFIPLYFILDTGYMVKKFLKMGIQVSTKNNAHLHLIESVFI